METVIKISVFLSKQMWLERLVLQETELKESEEQEQARTIAVILQIWMLRAAVRFSENRALYSLQVLKF